jgi:hypothetical protein
LAPSLSGFSEIITTLALAFAVIWLPGVVVIKASRHLRPPARAGAGSSTRTHQADR